MTVSSVTVVVPFQREAELLGRQLAALDGQEGLSAFDVVLVGSAVDAATERIATRWAHSRPRTRVVVSPQPLLPGAARNFGAGGVATQALAFCDADDEVAPDWLAAHLEALGAPGVGASGGPLNEEALNSPRVRRWRRPLAEDALPMGWWFAPYAVSANLAVRREVFDRVRGFDPSLRSCEDVDLCWRLAAAGQTVAFTPGAVVRYRHRERLASSMAQAFRWGHDSVGLVVAHRGCGQGPRLARPAELLRTLADDATAGAGRLARAAAYTAGLGVGLVRRPLAAPLAPMQAPE